jgi:hypothetical protein
VSEIASENPELDRQLRLVMEAVRRHCLRLADRGGEIQVVLSVGQSGTLRSNTRVVAVHFPLDADAQEPKTAGRVRTFRRVPHEQSRLAGCLPARQSACG